MVAAEFKTLFSPFLMGSNGSKSIPQKIANYHATNENLFSNVLPLIFHYRKDFSLICSLICESMSKSNQLFIVSINQFLICALNFPERFIALWVKINKQTGSVLNSSKSHSLQNERNFTISKNQSAIVSDFLWKLNDTSANHCQDFRSSNEGKQLCKSADVLRETTWTI